MVQSERKMPVGTNVREEGLEKVSCGLESLRRVKGHAQWVASKGRPEYLV